MSALLPERELQGREISTTDAVERSRIFLETKLKPDLEQTTAYLNHLEYNRDCYLRLHEELKEIQSDVQNLPSLAHLGQGMHVSIQVDKDALVIVSMGLRENDRELKSESGLYVQLTQAEAIAFSQKKTAILARRIKMAKEKQALIQGHAELTIQSIAQLEQLQAEPSSRLIDYLQT